MLFRLGIKNLALVNDLAIQFGPGYNSITGETGAGRVVGGGAVGGRRRSLVGSVGWRQSSLVVVGRCRSS